MKPLPHSWRAVAAVFLALACAALARSAESPLPSFVRYLGTPANTVPASDAVFVLRWSSPEGVAYEGWLRLGDRVGERRLAEFDPRTETLGLADPQGQLHRLALPAGHVRETSPLSDDEFAHLLKFLARDADRSAAPVLTREKARAFYLRYLGQMSVPPDAGAIIDLEGATLRPESRARWAQDRARARAEGNLLLAVLGKRITGTQQFLRNPRAVPEPMTRNLSDADWDDISMFEAANAIRQSNAFKAKLNSPTKTQK